MSEKNLWNKVREHMVVRKRWDEATRHEDKLNPGIADVSFCAGRTSGWMELKHIVWPKRVDTIVRCKHYTNEQKNFLKRKGKATGNAWLFVQAEKDHLLIHWTSAEQFGSLNKADTIALAMGHWHGTMDWNDFHEIIQLEQRLNAVAAAYSGDPVEGRY